MEVRESAQTRGATEIRTYIWFSDLTSSSAPTDPMFSPANIPASLFGSSNGRWRIINHRGSVDVILTMQKPISRPARRASTGHGWKSHPSNCRYNNGSYRMYLLHSSIQRLFPGGRMAACSMPERLCMSLFRSRHNVYRGRSLIFYSSYRARTVSRHKSLLFTAPRRPTYKLLF